MCWGDVPVSWMWGLHVELLDGVGGSGLPLPRAVGSFWLRVPLGISVCQCGQEVGRGACSITVVFSAWFLCPLAFLQRPLSRTSLTGLCKELEGLGGRSELPSLHPF